MQKTKELAFTYIDIYLRNYPIANECLYLLGITALFIAYKVIFFLPFKLIASFMKPHSLL